MAKASVLQQLKAKEIDVETAAQQLVNAEVCGPVEIRLEGFEPIYGGACSLTWNHRTASTSRSSATSSSNRPRPPSTYSATG